MIKLGKRLEAMACLVEKDSKIADIGTDHAYLCVLLYNQGICDTIIASDLNSGPLEAAKETLKEYNIEEAIDLRLGGGFSPYKSEEINSAIIAGMGGLLIAQIIDTHYALAKGLNYLILQPMQNPEALRMYLLTHEFEIISEEIVLEGHKYYEIIKCRFGVSQPIDPIKQEIGYRVSLSAQYKKFLEFRLRRHHIILESLSKQDQNLYRKEIQSHQNFIQSIQEVLNVSQF